MSEKGVLGEQLARSSDRAQYYMFKEEKNELVWSEQKAPGEIGRSCWSGDQRLDH